MGICCGLYKNLEISLDSLNPLNHNRLNRSRLQGLGKAQTWNQPLLTTQEIGLGSRVYLFLKIYLLYGEEVLNSFILVLELAHFILFQEGIF
jgi:hypothetical protein